LSVNRTPRSTAPFGGREEDVPVCDISKDDSPILMFFGTKDPLVPHSQAYEMLDAMTRAGVSGRAKIVANEGHGFRAPEMTRALRDGSDFLLVNMPDRTEAPAQAKEPAKK
jgi:dipeptidyl aminopeptidase/acylaminoacyl peptidase